MSGPITSIVLPVYNEAANIATCLRKIDAALVGVEHEILVCYDFDEDSTLPAISAMTDKPASVRLVKNTLGKGAANALRAGFAAARGDVVVTTMADLSDPPERIPLLADHLRTSGAAVVAGSRYMAGGSQSGGPFLKRTFSRLAGLSMRWITGVGTHDATNNFRAYSKSFLESVTVESKAGFEIALELTTKAHLMGLAVEEVPSSWTDRSAGESRFRMWKWMPNYLRWWFKATAVPLIVWSLFLAAFFVAWHFASGSGTRAPIQHAVVALFALLGAVALLVARRARRRTHLIDLVHVALWLHPFHANLCTRAGIFLDLPGTALASAGLLMVTLDRARLASIVGAAWGRVRPHMNQSTLGLAIVALFFWMTRIELPTAVATTDLDDGWQQVIGYGLRHHFQWGKDLIFTFGPLGYFSRGTFDPDLWWTKVLWWEFIFKFAVGVGFTLLVLRMSGLFERTLYIFALLTANGGFDSFFFLAIAGMSSFLLATPTLGVGWTMILLAMSTLIALNKFTSLVLFTVGVGGIALQRWITISRDAALRFVVLALFVFFTIWCLIGQYPWNFPAYIRSALFIAKGHNEAMSWDGEVAELNDAIGVLWAIAALAVLYSIARPHQLRTWISTALFLFGNFVAFKAGFTRHGSNSISFFTFAAVAPFLLLPQPAESAYARVLDALALVARAVIMWLALLGAGRVFGNPQVVPSQPTVAFIGRMEQAVDLIPKINNIEIRRTLEAQQKRNDFDLPEVRRVVGTEPIDLFYTEQGLVLLNGFNYRPRPVFQSYVVYTPELCRINADFMRSERAPHYVLFRAGSSDRRMPGSEDGEATLVLARDYKPVLAEKGWLLLEHAPKSPAPESKVLFEKSVGFDEWIDAKSLGSGPKLLALDAPASLLGKVRTFLYHAAHMYIDVQYENGDYDRFRVEPGMTHDGVLLDPLLSTQEDWIHWWTGEDCPRIARFRFRTDPASRPRYEPRLEVRVLDGSAYKPDPDATLRESLSYPMFTTHPAAIRTPFPATSANVDGTTVLVVHAPSELRFTLPPGPCHLYARYGLINEAWNPGKTDGVGFTVLARGESKKDQLLWSRFLNPKAVEADRGLQPLDLVIPETASRDLRLRTRVGDAGDATCDWAFWTGIAILPQ